MSDHLIFEYKYTCFLSQSSEMLNSQTTAMELIVPLIVVRLHRPQSQNSEA